MRGEAGEGAARLLLREVDGAVDPRFGLGHDGDGAGGDGGVDEVLAVEPLAAEGAEDRSGGDLAVVDREAGDGRRLAAAGQRAELHQCAAEPGARGGIKDDVSRSRLASGMTPRSAPARWMTRPTTGVAV